MSRALLTSLLICLPVIASAAPATTPLNQVQPGYYSEDAFQFSLVGDDQLITSAAIAAPEPGKLYTVVAAAGANQKRVGVVRIGTPTAGKDPNEGRGKPLLRYYDLNDRATAGSKPIELLMKPNLGDATLLSRTDKYVSEVTYDAFKNLTRARIFGDGGELIAFSPRLFYNKFSKELYGVKVDMRYAHEYLVTYSGTTPVKKEFRMVQLANYRHLVTLTDQPKLNLRKAERDAIPNPSMVTWLELDYLFTGTVLGSVSWKTNSLYITKELGGVYETIEESKPGGTLSVEVAAGKNKIKMMLPGDIPMFEAVSVGPDPFDPKSIESYTRYLPGIPSIQFQVKMTPGTGPDGNKYSIYDGSGGLIQEMLGTQFFSNLSAMLTNWKLPDKPATSGQ